MVAWVLLLFGTISLPATTYFHADLPSNVSEILTVVSVLGLFVAICALDAVGTGPARASD